MGFDGLVCVAHAFFVFYLSSALIERLFDVVFILIVVIVLVVTLVIFISICVALLNLLAFLRCAFSCVLIVLVKLLLLSQQGLCFLLLFLKLGFNLLLFNLLVEE